MPNLHMYGTVFRVSEISERGLRVEMGESFIGQRQILTGVLKLHATESVCVKGYVIRKEAHEVIFELLEGPTFKQMLEEQRYLRQHYPESFPKKSELCEL